MKTALVACPCGARTGLRRYSPLVILLAALGAAPAAAGPQDASAPPRASQDQLRTRYQLGVMERVLEQAVQHGAQVLGRTIQTVAPNLMLFSGPARARGFRLDGYGVFFDVEVPGVRKALAWSMSVMNQPDPGVARALQSLRQHVGSMPDGPSRINLEQALRRIEGRVGPADAANRDHEVQAMSAGARPAGAVGGPPTAAQIVDDPNEMYTNQVKQALIDAMLDHSGPIEIGANEWLTVAARDSEDRISPSDVYDVVTITLRISGADLTAFRADRLTREEARNRVEVRQF